MKARGFRTTAQRQESELRRDSGLAAAVVGPLSKHISGLNRKRATSWTYADCDASETQPARVSRVGAHRHKARVGRGHNQHTCVVAAPAATHRLSEVTEKRHCGSDQEMDDDSVTRHAWRAPTASTSPDKRVANRMRHGCGLDRTFEEWPGNGGSQRLQWGTTQRAIRGVGWRMQTKSSQGNTKRAQDRAHR